MSGGYAAKNGALHETAPRGFDEATEDFPMVCETCLGTNPYVRMVKLPMGHKLCKISGVPFQAFRWKAGAQGRYKETIISILVAKERNICQGCLKDMRYDLPAGVRDSLLRDATASSNGQELVQMPTSDVGTAYYYQSKALTEGYDRSSLPFAVQLQEAPAVRQLERFSAYVNPNSAYGSAYGPQGSGSGSAKAPSTVDPNINRTAWRNLPKLCSFWLNGTCNRVIKKSCPFRPCCGAYVFPEIAGTDKEIHKRLQAQLTEHGPAYVMKHMEKDVKDCLRNGLKTGNKDEAIRKRVNGEDDLSKKYLGKIQAHNKDLEPPEDTTVTTLWIGGVEPDITQDDILGACYAYGHIVNLHIARAVKCAFLEYASREMAEYAAKNLHNALILRGHHLQVKWAKPKPIADPTQVINTNDTYIPPPPGLENAPSESYIVSDLPGDITGRKRTAEEELSGGPAKRYNSTLPSMDPARLGAAIN